jgi:hypothetical protein
MSTSTYLYVSRRKDESVLKSRIGTLMACYGQDFNGDGFNDGYTNNNKKS